MNECLRLPLRSHRYHPRPPQFAAGRGQPRVRHRHHKFLAAMAGHDVGLAQRLLQEACDGSQPWSPAACPCRSLKDLKWSTSIIASDSGLPLRRARLTSAAMRSRK